MTTLRELKGLRIKDAIGKELAVQRAVWNWALYDDYIKTREVARKHGVHLSYYKNLFTHRGCGCGCTLDVLL